MKIKKIFLISRPIFWIWTVGAYLIGIGNFNNFEFLSIIEFLFMFVPINFIIYGLNDIYDIKSDEINPEKDKLQGTALKKTEIREVKKIATILSILFVFIAIIIGRLEHMIFSIGIILLAIIYSVPPIRLKSKPILDSIFGSIGYLFPILLAFTTHNTLSNIPWEYSILVLPMIGNHAISTLRDISCDKKSGTKTIGVFLGKRKTLILSFILYVIPLFFIQNIFLISVIVSSSFFILITSFTDLKKEKYIFPLISALFLVLNLTFIYFILKFNLG